MWNASPLVVTLPGESRAGRSRGHGRLHRDDRSCVGDGAVCDKASTLPVRLDRHVRLTKRKMIVEGLLVRIECKEKHGNHQSDATLTMVLSLSLYSTPLLVSARTVTVNNLSDWRTPPTEQTPLVVCTFLLHHFQSLQGLTVEVLQVPGPAGLNEHILLDQQGSLGLVIVIELQDSWKWREGRGDQPG